MADSDRIVFPDEVDAAKAEAAENKDKTTGGDSNSVEEPPPMVTSRNTIVVPPNCPIGYEMNPDGVCREMMD